MGPELDRRKTWGVRVEGRGIVMAAHAHIGRNSLNLTENGMWTVTKGKGTGHSPTQMQLLGILSEITTIAIRGNYFRKSEVTWIDGVRLLAGDQDASKLRGRVQKSALANVQPKTNAGHLVGVGVVFTQDAKHKSFKVKRLQSGSPALWSSIRVGDMLLQVDDERISEDMSLRQLAILLRGEMSSTVKLTFYSILRNTTYQQVLERVALDSRPPRAVESPPPPPARTSVDERAAAAAAAAAAAVAAATEERIESQRRRARLEELKRRNLEKEIQILQRKKEMWQRTQGSGAEDTSLNGAKRWERLKLQNLDTEIQFLQRQLGIPEQTSDSGAKLELDPDVGTTEQLPFHQGSPSGEELQNDMSVGRWRDGMGLSFFAANVFTGQCPREHELTHAWPFTDTKDDVDMVGRNIAATENASGHQEDSGVVDVELEETAVQATTDDNLNEDAHINVREEEIAGAEGGIDPGRGAVLSSEVVGDEGQHGEAAEKLKLATDISENDTENAVAESGVESPSRSLAEGELEQESASEKHQKNNRLAEMTDTSPLPQTRGSRRGFLRRFGFGGKR